MGISIKEVFEDRAAEKEKFLEEQSRRFEEEAAKVKIVRDDAEIVSRFSEVERGDWHEAMLADLHKTASKGEG